MYTIVTDKTYIPHSNNGDCNFLVLESDGEKDESNEIEAKYIYILLDSVSSIDIVSSKKKPEIRLYVLSRPKYIKLKDDQRNILFEIINNHMDECSEEDSD